MIILLMENVTRFAQPDETLEEAQEITSLEGCWRYVKTNLR